MDMTTEEIIFQRIRQKRAHKNLMKTMDNGIEQMKRHIEEYRKMSLYMTELKKRYNIK